MRARIFALAEALLKRFGVPQGNESLMGDIEEEYASGKSLVWLWRETTSAIVITIARDIRKHGLLASRAIVTGWCLLRGGNLVASHFLAAPGVWYRGADWHVVLRVLFGLMAWPVFVGWAVGRMHRDQQASMVIVYAASLVAYDVWYYCVYRGLVQDQVPVDCVMLVFTLLLADSAGSRYGTRDSQIAFFRVGSAVFRLGSVRRALAWSSSAPVWIGIDGAACSPSQPAECG